MPAELPLQMPSEGAFSIFYRGCKQSNLSTHSPLGALFGYKGKHFSCIYSIIACFFDKLTLWHYKSKVGDPKWNGSPAFVGRLDKKSYFSQPLCSICKSEITFINIPPKACGLLVRVACAVGLDATLSHGEDFLWQFTKIIFDLKVCCGFFFRWIAQGDYKLYFNNSAFIKPAVFSSILIQP